MKSRILLINPPIYDFAAFDFWLKPYGLLEVGGTLRASASLSLFDFTDRHHPDLPTIKASDHFGRGHFYSVPVAKPRIFSSIRRKFRRFGVPRDAFQRFLKSQDQFDFVLISVSMTYWYPGAQEVIEDLRQIQPKAKIVVGGIYSFLCPDHAAKLRADLVIKDQNLKPLWNFLSIKPNLAEPPLWESYRTLEYGVLKLTDGCPLSCTYCSVPNMYPRFSVRPLEQAIYEVNHLVNQGVKHLAFYDDALLVGSEESLLPFLEEARTLPSDLSFHTPNAMHARFLNKDIANALVSSGFKSFYFGFESISLKWQEETGGKVQSPDLEKAISNLISAGADPKDITAYLIFGHPKTDLQLLEESALYVRSLGIRVMLSDFSPIPGTPDGEACRKIVDLEEPLSHNKTAFPIKLLGEDRVNSFKQLIQKINA